MGSCLYIIPEKNNPKGETFTMKKFLLVALSVLMLSACGGEKQGSDTNTESERIGDRDFVEKSFETGDEKIKREILSEEEADFGNFKWGMPIVDIVNVHGAGYSTTAENTIFYRRIRIEGFASDAEYVFDDGKLSQATYFIMPDSVYDDKKQYLSDYEQLVSKYTKRFGTPVTSEIQFAEGKDTEDKAEQAELLAKGMLLFRTVWETDTTEIRVNMGKNEEGNVVIGVRNIPVNQ